jgi:3-hydroxyacyl-CoA dehydrogenase/3a,7a,12a-trihydroxy-5b-cholest-24-enoyl-CoA hydratase
MAKLGLHGFAQTLAIEGKAKNILVNTIAPVAGSRMTETIFPPEMVAKLKPEYISPLVVWLASEANREESGSLFEVGAGFVAKLRWERTHRYTFNTAQGFNADDVASAWGEVTDFTAAGHPSSVQQSFEQVCETVKKG